MAGKNAEIKIRVPAEMKARVLALAKARGEAKSVIVREAIREFLERHLSKGSENPNPNPNPKSAQLADAPKDGRKTRSQYPWNK